MTHSQRSTSGATPADLLTHAMSAFPVLHIHQSAGIALEVNLRNVLYVLIYNPNKTERYQKYKTLAPVASEFFLSPPIGLGWKIVKLCCV